MSCSTGLQQSNTALCSIAACSVVTSSPLNIKCPSVCRREAGKIMCVTSDEAVKIMAFSETGLCSAMYSRENETSNFSQIRHSHSTELCKQDNDM